MNPDDVAAVIARATDGPPGVYHVAGDGRMTVPEIARPAASVSRNRRSDERRSIHGESSCLRQIS